MATSVPATIDPSSRRPAKRRALSPTSAQTASITALFANPSAALTSDALTKTSSSSSGIYLPPPPEIVTNVQGSSAGAGSGEFHVYKASRRREYERLSRMDEETERLEADEKFEKEKEERERLDRERTAKNRKMREQKRNKGKKTGRKDTVEGKDVRHEDGRIRASDAALNSEAGKKDVKTDVVNSITKVDDEVKNGQNAETANMTSQGEVGIIIHDDAGDYD